MHSKFYDSTLRFEIMKKTICTKCTDLLFWNSKEFDVDNTEAMQQVLGTSMYYYTACTCTMCNLLLLGKSLFWK